MLFIYIDDFNEFLLLWVSLLRKWEGVDVFELVKFELVEEYWDSDEYLIVMINEYSEEFLVWLEKI